MVNRFLLTKLDMLHFVIYNSQSLLPKDLQANIEETKELYTFLRNSLYEIEFILQDEKSLNNILIEEALAFLQNMRLSIQSSARNLNDIRVFSCELPTMQWNLFHLIHQFVEGCDASLYEKNLQERYSKLYSQFAKENILAIKLFVDDDLKSLEWNIREANNISGMLNKKCELITIAESAQEMELQDRISNDKRIRIFYPVRFLKIPPWIANGKFIMDVPKGAKIPSGFSEHLDYLLKEDIKIYEVQLDSGIKVGLSETNNIPYYNMEG